MAGTEKIITSLVDEQLGRIISSAGFRNSTILCGFLQFIVAETLAGREKNIKEYTIGVNVLSRNSDFNPQFDAIVRIHAGRLRRALKEYYSDAGKNDTVYIDIPKGTYVPVFHSPGKMLDQGNNKNMDSVKTKPTVAVFPFRNISNDASRDFFADGLGEQLSNDLSLFQDLFVISYYASRSVAKKTNDLIEAAQLIRTKYVLTGSIQNDLEHLRISVQLILVESGELLWAKSFERSNTASGLFDIQNEIVKNVLTAVGGYYGAIISDVMKAPGTNRAKDIESYDALFWYYHYQKVFTADVFHEAIQALETAVQRDPGYAIAWAMLGELYLDERALEFKKVDKQIEEALKCVQRAIKIDPNCQHAYVSLTWVHLFLHDKEQCLIAVDKCLTINPNASAIVGSMGFALVCAGEFDQGAELLNDTVRHNHFCPWWFYLGLVYYYISKREFKEALRWADKMDMPNLLWDPLLKATCLANLNRMDEAVKNLELLRVLNPEISIQAKDIVGAFLLSEELKNEIIDGLVKAGLNLE